MTNSLRILVKGRSLSQRLALGQGSGALGGEASPLFTSIGAAQTIAGAPGTSWSIVQLAQTSAALDAPNAWQICHDFVDRSRAAGLAVDFAEPDLQQNWLVGRDEARGLAISGNCAAADRQNGDFPTSPDNFWIRDASHGQYNLSLAASPDPGDAARVRIAHLDTGYDPGHDTLPQFLNRKLQRNFVDTDRPNDASDDTTGLFTNLGHGTGTLSLLAGKALGGGGPTGVAPYAEVTPIRVADRVVLFWNSAIAKAFDYVHSLCATPATRIHVVTMSMGGAPSQAWAEAVNALYDAGVFVVTAAGNNYANLPVRQIVYPARFQRVVAACGVMCDGRAYADLPPQLMAGNYGPPDKMATAMAAYTPNTTWARLGCPHIVDFDGSGTSAATPQIAGTAALWISKHRAAYDAYPEPWMRVEAVRDALFASARAPGALADHLGRGSLAAFDALSHVPAAAAALRQTGEDAISLSTIGEIVRAGAAPEDADRRRMIELEAAQAIYFTGLPEGLSTDARDPRASVAICDALLAKRNLSDALRAAVALKATKGAQPGWSAPPQQAREAPHWRADDLDAASRLTSALDPPAPRPPSRRLRVFAFDPSASADLETFASNSAIVEVKWEEHLRPGPIGEYLEVVDIDPASGCAYAPVDLNDPYLLASNGLAPSEALPKFHQQMTYAVAMRTIGFFEKALGRTALWRTRYVRDTDGNFLREEFVRRLRIYPHALRARNSYYDSERLALLFGYFTASGPQLGAGAPGGRVFCALSHDIVAHETTHALLDGLHRRYQEATNPDVLSFHEAFADIVALFQHFTIPEALFDQIRRARGDLESELLLGQLAVQFGQATTGGYAALRDAIGARDAAGKWVLRKPSRDDYLATDEPHGRGAVLVSAVFFAFVKLYRQRAGEFVRLATGGTGVLPEGEISHALAERLSVEASKLAAQILTMCVRALDYCPPVDITFGDFLRALVTADRDLVPDDPRGYRVALIAAFRDRGIYPSGVPSLSVDSAVWEAPPAVAQTSVAALLDGLDASWSLDTDRKTAWRLSDSDAFKVHQWIVDPAQSDFYTALGFEPAARSVVISRLAGDLRPVEVHSVRPANRIGPDGQHRASLIIELTQTFRAAPDQRRYRGGCTLILDARAARPEYIVRKRLRSLVERQAVGQPTTDGFGLSENYFPLGGQPRGPFALLHRSH